jgi:hypothetical protein
VEPGEAQVARHGAAVPVGQQHGFRAERAVRVAVPVQLGQRGAQVRGGGQCRGGGKPVERTASGAESVPPRGCGRHVGDERGPAAVVVPADEAGKPAVGGDDRQQVGLNAQPVAEPGPVPAEPAQRDLPQPDAQTVAAGHVGCRVAPDPRPVGRRPLVHRGPQQERVRAEPDLGAVRPAAFQGRVQLDRHGHLARSAPCRCRSARYRAACQNCPPDQTPRT